MQTELLSMRVAGLQTYKLQRHKSYYSSVLLLISVLEQLEHAFTPSRRLLWRASVCYIWSPPPPPSPPPLPKHHARNFFIALCIRISLKTIPLCFRDIQILDVTPTSIAKDSLSLHFPLLFIVASFVTSDHILSVGELLRTMKLSLQLGTLHHFIVCLHLCIIIYS